MNATEPQIMFGHDETPVPAARFLTDFCIERVGDDVVLFDPAFDRYHTLNTVAFDIWRRCDGIRSIEQIAYPFRLEGITSDIVVAAVAQLGASGLLQAPEHRFEPIMYRRRILQLAAAGAIGATVVPIIASITSPDSAAAQTCPGIGDSCNETNPCCSGLQCRLGQCALCYPDTQPCPGSDDPVKCCGQCDSSRHVCISVP